ncbi:unnamed protein product [Pleuronectes platessa]|uniref:Uncharacterized protein n=1 Tax=Pleuronectes platessa TaxID=8262 RepID=A0A9N7YXY5_PLEPL|nr:unnamed protein product [Pleuronectes platessa]
MVLHDIIGSRVYRLDVLPLFKPAPTGESHRFLIGRVPAWLYWVSCLVALSDNVVVTLTAQAKPETDDKHRHSTQSHVVPDGLTGPGNSTPALPTAPALTQHNNIAGAQTAAALLTLSVWTRSGN